MSSKHKIVPIPKKRDQEGVPKEAVRGLLKAVDEQIALTIRQLKLMNELKRAIFLREHEGFDAGNAQNVMEFSEQDLRFLKAAYKKAVEAGDGSFNFRQQVLVVGYAKYLIEYLENEFNK